MIVAKPPRRALPGDDLKVARIVLNTFGSFGDIHPYLAVAIGLKGRGYDVVIATSEVYRAKIESEGVGFAPVRPNVGDLLGNAEFLKKLWDPLRGSEYLIRDYILPAIEASYDDLFAAFQQADLLLTHPVFYAGPIVAEKLKMRWLSVVLQPLLFFSTYDRTVLSPLAVINKLGVFGHEYYRLLYALAKWRSGFLAGPIHKLRKKVGLPPKTNPLFQGWFSPHGNLVLFSSHFARPQRDWPRNVTVCGFPFYDRFGIDDRLDSDLHGFLNDGPPPVLFTLGSSAVMYPGSFFRESLEAATQMQIRALLLTGAMPDELSANPLPPNIHVAGYAPYSEVMPRCAAIVHQAGIGTTAQALRAGRPMMAVPWAHDQPDNAERLRRLGVSRTVRRKSYTARTVIRNLEIVLGQSSYRDNAEKIGAAIRTENAVAAACDAIDSAMRDRP